MSHVSSGYGLNFYKACFFYGAVLFPEQSFYFQSNLC